jgi:hypothetical protein
MDFRVVLDNERIPSWGGGTVTAMHIEPSLSRAQHFCGLHCLRKWVDGARSPNHRGSASLTRITNP